MRYFPIILLVLFSVFHVKAEITYYGNYGQNLIIDLPTEHTISEPSEVSILIEISNPSLVLPLKIIGAEYEHYPEKINDKTYKFEFAESQTDVQLNYQLVVKLLAGNDIECLLTFAEFKIDEKSILAENIRIITQNVPRGVTYHRFPYISVPSPNPVSLYEEATWTYRIDEPSRVTIKIFTLAGKMLHRYEYLDVEAGYHTFNYTFNEDYGTGTYIIQVGTNHGSAISKFLLMK